MAYTHRRTGSARSVGRRRIIKLYAANASGTGPATHVVLARSAAGARQDAKLAGLKLTGAFVDAVGALPVVDRRKGITAGGGGGGTPQTVTVTAAQFDVTGAAADGDTPGSETGAINLDFGGKAVAANATVTFTITTDAGAQAPIPVALTAGMHAPQAEQAIVTAINNAGITGVSAVKGAGTAIELTAAAGTQITGVTVAVT